MRTDDIKNYSVTECLRDERSVTIRAVRPDDKGLVIDALNEVSPESIYSRLFAPKKEFSSEDLKQITEVDFVNVVALVAVMKQDGSEQVVGGGRYIRLERSERGQSAEVAFLVGDAFQGLGIASRIFGHLVAIARDAGITRFEAEVLPWNKAMLRIFTRGGVPVTTTTTLESVHVVMHLTGDEKASATDGLPPHRFRNE